MKLVDNRDAYVRVAMNTEKLSKYSDQCTKDCYSSAKTHCQHPIWSNMHQLRKRKTDEHLRAKKEEN